MAGELLQQRPVTVVPSHLKNKKVKTNYNLEAARWKVPCKQRPFELLSPTYVGRLKGLCSQGRWKASKPASAVTFQKLKSVLASFEFQN